MLDVGVKWQPVGRGGVAAHGQSTKRDKRIVEAEFGVEMRVQDGVRVGKPEKRSLE